MENITHPLLDQYPSNYMIIGTPHTDSPIIQALRDSHNRVGSNLPGSSGTVAPYNPDNGPVSGSSGTVAPYNHDNGPVSGSHSNNSNARLESPPADTGLKFFSPNNGPGVVQKESFCE